MSLHEIVVINVVGVCATFFAAFLGAHAGARHALRSARVLASRTQEPAVEIGGVVMPQSHYYAATAPFREADGGLVLGPRTGG